MWASGGLRRASPAPRPARPASASTTAARADALRRALFRRADKAALQRACGQDAADELQDALVSNPPGNRGLRDHFLARPAGSASLSGSCPSSRGFAPRFLQTPSRDDALAFRQSFAAIGLD